MDLDKCDLDVGYVELRKEMDRLGRSDLVADESWAHILRCMWDLHKAPNHVDPVMSALWVSHHPD